ncbi:MAG: membrane dipeptidase [Segetibacter sp.]
MQPNPYAYANRQIDTLYAWAARNPSQMVIVKTPKQLKQAVKENKLAAMMGMEGGHMMENDINKLDSLFNQRSKVHDPYMEQLKPLVHISYGRNL